MTVVIQLKFPMINPKDTLKYIKLISLNIVFIDFFKLYLVVSAVKL